MCARQTHPAICAARAGLVLVMLVTLPAVVLGPTPTRAASGQVDATATATAAGTASELLLANKLIDALNRGDEGAAVGLFDLEATLRMDRFAWAQAEIHRWVHLQIAESIVLEPEGPIQAVPNRAFWTARVRRADWVQAGVSWLRLACQVVTEADRIVDFSADPLDAPEAARLGSLWRPGSAPAAPPAARTVPEPAAADAGPSHPTASEGVLVVVLAVLLVGSVTLRARRTTHRRRSNGLIYLLRARQLRDARDR
jgi:hypothetical protein